MKWQVNLDEMAGLGYLVAMRRKLEGMARHLRFSVACQDSPDLARLTVPSIPKPWVLTTFSPWEGPQRAYRWERECEVRSPRVLSDFIRRGTVWF